MFICDMLKVFCHALYVSYITLLNFRKFQSQEHSSLQNRDTTCRPLSFMAVVHVQKLEYTLRCQSSLSLKSLDFIRIQML